MSDEVTTPRQESRTHLRVVGLDDLVLVAYEALEVVSRCRKRGL